MLSCFFSNCISCTKHPLSLIHHSTAKLVQLCIHVAHISLIPQVLTVFLNFMKAHIWEYSSESKFIQFNRSQMCLHIQKREFWLAASCDGSFINVISNFWIWWSRWCISILLNKSTQTPAFLSIRIQHRKVTCSPIPAPPTTTQIKSHIHSTEKALNGYKVMLIMKP